MKNFKLLVLGMLAALLMMMLATPAGAASDPNYDMTTDGAGAVEEATINSAIWKTLPVTDATGSGVFNAFFRVKANGTEQGYNTDGRPLQFDELKSATFTHSALLADVPLVEYPEGSGNWYYEFQLDLNESKNTPYISLDEFQVWTTNDQYLLDYNDTTNSFPIGSGTGQAQLVYDLNGDGNTYIIMDYRWNTGSGKRDYKVLVSESDFTGKELTYVVIFTRHGDNIATDDGFEEWGVAIYPVVYNPMIEIEKTAELDTICAEDGNEVTYDYIVSNTGDIDLENVLVNDDKCGPLVRGDDNPGNDDDILDIDEVWSYSCTTTLPLGTTINTVVVSANDVLFGSNLNAWAEASVTIFSTPGCDIISGPAIVDALDADLQYCAVDDPDYTYSWSISSGDATIISDPTQQCVDVNSGEDDFVIALNIVDSNGCQSDCDLSVMVIHPEVDIEKVAEPNIICEEDSNEVTYDYFVSNTGDVNLINVLVNDDKCGPLEREDDIEGNDDDILDIDEVWSYSCATTLPLGTTINTVIVSAEDELINSDVNDTTQATVIIYPTPYCDIISGPTVVNALDTGLEYCGEDDSDYTYSWSISAGDATITSEPNQQCVNVDAGLDDFTVDLHITDGNGCQSDCNLPVTVRRPEPCVQVEKLGECDISMEGETIKYYIDITNCAEVAMSRVSVYDTILGDLNSIADACGCDVLDFGETCTIYYDYVVPADSPNPIENTVTVVYEDYLQQTDDANDSDSINLIYPDFEVTKDCLNEPVPPGGSVIFKVEITNTGDVALEFTTNEPCLPGPFTLDPAADVNVVVSRTFTDNNDLFNQVIVTANLAEETCLDINDIVKEANDTCLTGGGATRTPGFWQTHCLYTQHVFECHLGSFIDLGWVQITEPNELFAVFYAKNAHNSDGTRRSKKCQAQVTVSFHALAAILNSALDNGATLPVPEATIANILLNGTAGEIRTLGGILGDYNESGDNITIIELDECDGGECEYCGIPPADPSCSRMLAASAEVFPDCEQAEGKPSKGHGKPPK